MEIVQWRRNFICFFWKCKSCSLCSSPFVLQKVFYILWIPVQILLRFLCMRWFWILFFSLKHFLSLWLGLCRRLHSRGVQFRDDWILDFYSPILSCSWKIISVSDPNAVLVQIILAVSENYPKVYYHGQHGLHFCVVSILPHEAK